MLIPIRCFSCNKVVGDKYEEYIQKSKDKSKDNKEILDDLGLNRYCCRRHMITTVDLMEII
jgi:DNA-directed RNA polymerase subunit N|tara:strand:+ start:220 stop:402 length:183 start_codon:yes stop_codon:yes gene_type:complete